MDEAVRQQVQTLKTYIDEAENIVFFGGAGVSTESGIPDFRSKDGLYNQHDVQFDEYEPEYLLSKSCLYHNPKVFYEFYRQKLDVRNVEPNAAHKYLAYLESTGKLKAVITQNIDGLHQKAGSKTVYEIHGTTKRIYCNKCGKEYPEDYLFTNTDPIPKCECGGQIRPDVTLYEENLPKEALANAEDAVRKADLLIIGGTSLQVYPAASLPSHYMGDRMVVINKEKPEMLLGENDLVIQEAIGEVFEELAKLQGVTL
jgi:NAD-dependent deacetylase